MVEESADAYQAIGEYFCAFSTLERELGETIKVIFRLEAHEAKDTIVAALGDVSKKINVVWTASQFGKRADGSDTGKDWKENADKTMAAIWKCNGDRNQLAHSFLEPKADGSVELTRLRLEGGELRGADDPNKWTQDNFRTKLKQLKGSHGRASKGEGRSFQIQDHNSRCHLEAGGPFSIYTAPNFGSPLGVHVT